MELQLPNHPTPDHVPESLVQAFPFIFGITTTKDPFNDLAASIHKGPEIFYAKHAYPGASPAWIARRAEDLRHFYFDNEHFSTKDFAPFSKLVGGNWGVWPVELDPPRHGSFRALVSHLFTPKAMSKLEDKIRQYAREYIESFKEKGECEFMSEFAFEFPIKVFTELMGLPQEMTPTFLAWEMDLIHNHDMEKITQATHNVVNYLQGLIDDRRENPRDDLISWAVNAELEGRPLTNDELIGFTFNLFIGGLDTVSTHMGLQFLHLAKNPGDQQLLRENPDMLPAAIEELMRAYPAVTTFRTCIKTTQYKGITFMPGDKIAMCTTLSGRDPEEYENANIIRFDRKPRHNSFGYGPHLCVGFHLARREMRIAMEEFLRLIPEFSLQEDYTVEYHLGMIQPVSLPLRWK